MTASEHASKLLKELELEGTNVISLQRVIDHIGYKAQLFPKSEKTRMIACGVNRDTKVIMANAGEPAAEQRYAFCHAIGHVVLHENGNVVDKKANLSPENEEYEEFEANSFADELLMESDLFLRNWDAMNANISKLANTYALSRERVTARARKLGLIR